MAIMEDGVLEGVLPELIDLCHTIHSRPIRGRVVLLFRSQEENGRGAPAVLLCLLIQYAIRRF